MNPEQHIAEIKAKCDEGRPIRRFDVKFLLEQLAEARRREKADAYGMSKKQLVALAGIEERAKIIRNLHKIPNGKLEIKYAESLADGILERVKYIREWRGADKEDDQP